MTQASTTQSGRRRWVIAILAVVVALVVAGVLVVLTRPAAITVSQQFVAGTPEPDGTAVQLDTTLYLPAHRPAPAIVLAHGFGGTKESVDGQARSLAQHGYVVLAYTARGFGRSGGLIHLDSLDYEVPDARRLVDYLAARPDVLHQQGQPVVGVAGSSYGGALALMLGATDHRVRAVAADITWNNLEHALFPNAAGGTGTVFKKLWTGYLFSLSSSAAPASRGSDTRAAGGSATAAAGTVGCGRFAPAICALYQSVGRTSATSSSGALAPAMQSLLDRSSPSAVLGRMAAPTLLMQGEQDSLFDLGQADANARQIAAAGAPVQVRWRAGGHDDPTASDDVSGWERQFFDKILRGPATSSGTADAPGSASSAATQAVLGRQFLIAERGAAISATSGRNVDTTLSAEGYPAISGGPQSHVDLPLTGASQQISAPAGGSPAAVTSLPGLGSVLGAASAAGIGAVTGLGSLPNQTATFVTQPLASGRRIVGSSLVHLAISAAGGNPAGATLFVSLRDEAPDGTTTLPANLVSPVQVPLSQLPHRQTVTVALPWIVADIPAGHRIAVVVSTTDFAYAMPADAREYSISLDRTDTAVTIPVLATRTISSGAVARWPILAALVVLLCAGFLTWRLRLGRASAPDPALADVPIAVTDLVKEYADSYRAVDGVSFRVERGQVLGLLGPNGAGKTTTLRVLMGLILPTSGTIRVFGHEVVPGAPVLAALGAFVEGPGLLPHLTGRENLRLYWAATGRDEDEAELDTVLEIAGLGASLDRRVKTYSHGMQQRLAIAQAMLGLPEVLVLDEPTNGLDPPQIAEMREVLKGYAATGRTVIVSSHLLAEVEQTCTHVVVMARGRLVAAGSVSDVAGAGSEQLVVDDPAHALRVLAEAGITASTVPARRALEDVFLDLVGERHD